MHGVQSQPELAFADDGDDLLVTTTVRANNSPHVLWTGVNIFRGKVIPAGGRIEHATDKHRVSLQYCIVQNRDLFKRSFKYVQVTWRIRREAAGGATFDVTPVFCPNSAELLELLPDLKALAEHTSEPRRT